MSSLRSALLDGVPDVLDAGHRQGSVHEQPDHVDAARLLLPVGLRAVELEEGPQLALLACVDSLLGSAETDAAACLDLDEDQGLAVLGDDIDLAESRAPVPSQDAKSLLLEIGERRRLTGVTDPVLEGSSRRQLLRASRPSATLRCRSPSLQRVQPRRGPRSRLLSRLPHPSHRHCRRLHR
jgi:hypothetical protein